MKKFAKTEYLIWGVFWIVIGVLLLIHSFRPEMISLATILRLWPVLIIIIGLNIIVRFFRKKDV
jgi:hypothetical protein